MKLENIEARFKKHSLEDVINSFGPEEGRKQFEIIENIRNDYSRGNDLFGSMYSNENLKETFISVFGEDEGLQKYDFRGVGSR